VDWAITDAAQAPDNSATRTNTGTRRRKFGPDRGPDRGPQLGRSAGETLIGQDFFDFYRGRRNIPGRQETGATSQGTKYDNDQNEARFSHADY